MLLALLLPLPVTVSASEPLQLCSTSFVNVPEQTRAEALSNGDLVVKVGDSCAKSIGGCRRRAQR